MKHSTTIKCGSRRRLRAWIPVAAIGIGWLITAAAQDVANGTLAAAIRASGHPCGRVIEKERVSENASVWRVKCNSGHFQVTMKGNTASEVLPLD